MGLKDIFRGREKADREMTENPYLNARKQWNFIMGDMVSSRLLWQWAGMTGLLIGLGGVGGMIYLGSQSKFIPYIVEVNKLGETVAVARADQPQATDERIVRAMLGSFIGNARTVTTDIALQRKIRSQYLCHAESERRGRSQNERMAERNAGVFAVQTRGKRTGQRGNQVGAETKRQLLAGGLGGNHSRP